MRLKRPTKAISDNVKKTFSFTKDPESPLDSQYEQSDSFGAHWTPMKIFPIPVLDYAAISQIRARVAAREGKQASIAVYNTKVFTAPLTDPIDEPPPPVVHTLSVDKTDVKTGDLVEVSFKVSSPVQRDGIGLYKESDTNEMGKEKWWLYTGGLPSGKYTVPMPPLPGDYEFRLFLNDSYTETAASEVITVKLAPPPPPPPPSSSDVTFVNNVLSNEFISLKIATDKSQPPITAIKYPDGTWQNFTGISFYGTCETLTIVKTGNADSISILVHYKVNAPAFTHEGITEPANANAFFKKTITLKKGDKFFTYITHILDTDVTYSLPTNFTQMRWRGYESNSIKQGYWLKNGIKAIYEPPGDRPGNLDALVDLPTDTLYMSLWSPPGLANRGRYIVLSGGENMLGLFHGKPSLMIGAAECGVKLMGQSVFFGMLRRDDSAGFFREKRCEIGVYVGTKADLGPLQGYSPVLVAQNYAAGLGARIDGYFDNYLIPTNTYKQGAIYMDIKPLIARIKDFNDSTYQDISQSDDAFYRMAAQLWRGVKTSDTLYNEVVNFGKKLRDNFKTGEGIYPFYDPRIGTLLYWRATFTFNDYSNAIIALLTDGKMTASQQTELYKVLSAMARIVWDDDFSPMHKGSGADLGNENMPIMYINNAGGRNYFTTVFADSDEFKVRFLNLEAEVKTSLSEALSPLGNSHASPHYTDTTAAGLLSNMLLLKQAGKDLFRDVLKFAEFFGRTLTSNPQARFKGYRKTKTFGDGSEETQPSLALLATGLKDIDPVLSEMLMGIFQQSDKLKSSSFVTMYLAIDLKPVPLRFVGKSASYPEYLSHLRTPDISVWVIHGSDYRDHRHDETGHISIDAYDDPLMLKGSSFYNPHPPHFGMSASVVPEAKYPEWKGMQPLRGNLSGWDKGKLDEFTTDTIKMSSLNWSRSVQVVNGCIVIRDTLPGNSICSFPFLGKVVGIPVIPKTIDEQYSTVIPNNLLPVATTEQAYTNGKWLFNGNAISWHLFSVGSGSFTVSELTTNYIKNVSEAQSETIQYFRMRKQNHFNLILPFKGNDPYLSITEAAGKVTVKLKNGTQFIV